MSSQRRRSTENKRFTCKIIAMDENSNKAKQLIENAKKIAIFGHMSPDGDCIGAMLGLGKLLENQKKKVKYFVPNKPSKIFDFLKGIEKIKSNFDYKNYDLLIFVDFTGIGRTGMIYQNNPNYFTGKSIVTFDHHIDDDGDISTLMIKDAGSISACEILFEHTHKWRPEFYDKDIATYLYLGINSDSGNFLFEEDHIRTFSNVVQLLKLDADKDLIVNNLLRKKSFNAIKFLKLLLDRMKQEGNLLYTYYDEDELVAYNIDHEEAAYGLHVIQNIDGPEIVVLMRKAGNTIRWSLRAKKNEGENRSQGKIDCNMIAKALWWGGHRLAAWFGVPLTGVFETQIQEIVKTINTMIA